MRLISLNTWGGQAGLSGLEEFFRKYEPVEVFCLQEIWQVCDLSLIDAPNPAVVLNLLEEIASFLPNHRYFFRPQYRGVFGLATFVRKDLSVIEEGEHFVFGKQGDENRLAVGNHARNIQYLTVPLGQSIATIINFHGLWNGKGKTDSPDRLQQSQNIADFIQKIKNPVALIGDFNLLPDIESFRILKEVCPRDLIFEHGVKSTRSRFYEKPGKLADYLLASNGLKISDFKVLPDEVSDHLALSALLEV
jgi:exonuclease III